MGISKVLEGSPDRLLSRQLCQPAFLTIRQGLPLCFSGWYGRSQPGSEMGEGTGRMARPENAACDFVGDGGRQQTPQKAPSSLSVSLFDRCYGLSPHIPLWKPEHPNVTVCGDKAYTEAGKVQCGHG